MATHDGVGRSVSLPGISGGTVLASVRERGEGRPIVFLHGLVGLNEHWEPVVDGLSDAGRCLSLELPLFDLDGPDCCIDGVVSLASSFLMGEVGEPAVLVGNSFGGHVALRVAIDRPDLVRALVLCGSSGLLEKRFDRVPLVRPPRSWFAERIGELFHERPPCLEEEIDRACLTLSRRRAARAMVRLSRSARHDHLGDRIGLVTHPTLLVWGREDVVTPPSAAMEFLARLPDARIAWIDRCGHAPMIEAPGALVEASRAFVRELDGVGAATDARPAGAGG